MDKGRVAAVIGARATERSRDPELTGRVSRRLAVGEWTLVETVCQPGVESASHRCTGPRFTLVVSGRYTAAGRLGARVCTPPDVVFDASESGSAAFDENGGKCFSLQLEQHALVDGVWNAGEELACYRDGGRISWIMARMYREFRMMDDLSVVTLRGLALHLIAASSRRMVEPRRQPEAGWLARAEGLLREQFAAPPPLKEIAAVVDVHPVSLARAFRRRFGISPGAYTRLLRVQFASRALASSDKPVREIASAAGFANKSHLTRTFKKHSGLTPQAYRVLFRSR